MREKKEERQLPTLPAYESCPPLWLPKLHGSADLGFIGFHPPRPGQDEDNLSESNIKNGFILPHPVPVESFSAHAMMNESLHSNDTLKKLEELMNDVFTRRTDRFSLIPASTFRIPTRVTLNDAKRQAWFADLANPEVPLYKLGKSVPHGAKGGDLLELLHSNDVEISRAVWFLRVFGANETAGLRNKPSYVPTQHSIDWANVVTGYMKKQLLEIALPSAPRPLLNIKQTFKGVLGDVDSRERWVSRFKYCLQLLRTFYKEDMVDHRTYLTWLVHQMSTCNLAQAGFLTRLVDEYLSDILCSRALSKPLVEALLARILEIRTTSARDILKDTENLLKELLQRACLTLPDAFVSPKMWSTYSFLLTEVLYDPQSLLPAARSVEQNARNLEGILLSNFSDIRKRNEALLFRDPLAEASAHFGTAVSDVKLLNSIGADTDMSSVPYFGQGACDHSFKEKLDLLLTWCVTPLQYGDHRPFAAATLIRMWWDKACDRASRRELSIPNDLLQDQLFDWLDRSETADDPKNITHVALLYGRLIEYGVFSYSGYIQRLIARGEDFDARQSPVSRHRLLLDWIPIPYLTPSLSHQRRVALYSSRTRVFPEDLIEREIRKEIRLVIPDLFEGVIGTTWSSTKSLFESCKTLMNATRYIQVRTFRQWLLPVFKNNITTFSRVGTDFMPLSKSYIIAVELMTATKCFGSALDLTLCMLEQSSDMNSMNSLINMFYCYSTIWACMDMIPAIVKALDTTRHLWKLRGLQSRPLLTLLMNFDNGRYLDDVSRDRIASDIATFTLALQPIGDQPDIVPDVLPEILLLAADPDPAAPSILANGLWIKYRTSADWAWKVWDNTIASLRQIPSMAPDIEGRRAHALRYGDFLWRVDQHLPRGLDDAVLEWLLGPGRAEVAALTSDAWDVLQVVLLFLVIHDALKATTVLRGLVYPAWQLGATWPSGQPLAAEIHLSAANRLCLQVLLQDDVNGNAVPPTNLFEVQCIRTRRQAVYEESHFPLLIASVPALISLEENECLSEILRAESTDIRHRLCQDPAFRRGAYRNLDNIRNAFENSPYLTGRNPGCENITKRAIAGLKMILCDSSDESNAYDWPELTCLLTPWKIAATTIQMQLQIKQLGRAISLDSTSECASEDLNKVVSMLFHHTKTAEEAYYVGEMARGADSNIVAKFINTGFQCMTEILTESPEPTPGCVRRVGDLLRVLIHVSQPCRDAMSTLPTVDPLIQEEFAKALDDIFKAYEREMLDNNVELQERENLILLARLLQFALSFKTAWTSTLKEIYITLSKFIFRLTLYCTTKDSLDITTYPILFDTLVVIYDEMHGDYRSVTFDPFLYYPEISPDELPHNMPPEYRKQIAALLVPSNPVSLVTNLVNTHRDHRGSIIYGPPVVNKPWEWIESLGEPLILDPKEEERERQEKERLKVSRLLKNSSSISLDYFGVRIVGDGARNDMLNDDKNPVEGCTRHFEDGLSENIFIRDWRESRLVFEPSTDSRSRQRQDLDPESFVIMDPTISQALRASPSSSAISRSSTALSGLRQQQQSPAVTIQSRSSVVHEVIDVDTSHIGGNSIKGKDSLKRKVASATTSDDELEIIEGPVVTRSMVNVKRQKATKVPATDKNKAKKK